MFKFKTVLNNLHFISLIFGFLVLSEGLSAGVLWTFGVISAKKSKNIKDKLLRFFG
jgi:hypothetical protein